MWGVYLPFWSFEGAASVIVQWDSLSIGNIMPGAYPAGDVLVGGVTRPSQAILYELMPYDLDALIAYDTRYLARWSAQIYNIDVIQASLTARAYIKYAARRQAARYRFRRSNSPARIPTLTPRRIPRSGARLRSIYR